MPEHVVTVTEVLDGHVALDVQCLYRIHLNAYVPTLQTSAQVGRGSGCDGDAGRATARRVDLGGVMGDGWSIGGS